MTPGSAPATDLALGPGGYAGPDRRGGVFSFGTPFHGSLASAGLTTPFVGLEFGAP